MEGKTYGFLWGLWHGMESDTYDPNDLGARRDVVVPGLDGVWVDTSLIEEWEGLRHPDLLLDKGAEDSHEAHRLLAVEELRTDERCWSDVLAEAGYSVVVLEKGPWFRETDFFKDEIACCRRSTYTPNLLDERHVLEEPTGDARDGGRGEHRDVLPQRRREPDVTGLRPLQRRQSHALYEHAHHLAPVPRHPADAVPHF